MDFIAVAGGIQRGKLIGARQMASLTASGVGVIQRVGVADARPGFVILLLGTGGGSRFRRQLWPLEFHITHGERVRHMAPHLRLRRIGAGGNGKFHAAVDGRGNQ